MAPYFCLLSYGTMQGFNPDLEVFPQSRILMRGDSHCSYRVEDNREEEKGRLSLSGLRWCNLPRNERRRGAKRGGPGLLRVRVGSFLEMVRKSRLCLKYYELLPVGRSCAKLGFLCDKNGWRDHATTCFAQTFFRSHLPSSNGHRLCELQIRVRQGDDQHHEKDRQDGAVLAT